MKFFEVLADVKKSSLRGQLLLEKSSDDRFLRALKEIAVNVVNKNIPLNKVQKTKLQRHGTSIKKLANVRTRGRRKNQKLIKQTGGFLPILIPALISVLSTIASNKLAQ